MVLFCLVFPNDCTPRILGSMMEKRPAAETALGLMPSEFLFVYDHRMHFLGKLIPQNGNTDEECYLKSFADFVDLS